MLDPLVVHPENKRHTEGRRVASRERREPMGLNVRPMSAEEQDEIARLSRARTAPARTVERAKIIAVASQGLSIRAIAEQLHLKEKVVRRWVSRFNAEGIAGLADRPRSGRPAIYTTEQVGVIIEVALTPPADLNQPFGSWSFERLARYLHEVKGIAIQHSRVHELLTQEGLRWREQESWFGARVDPDFAQKRGASKRSISSLLLTV